MLDERLRRRVADIADADEGGLDDAARERIFARMRVDGPELVARARRQRAWTRVAMGAAVAAAAAAFVVFRHPGGEGKVARSVSGSAAPACASRGTPESARDGFVASADGARLDLGAVAVAAAESGSVVRLAEAAPCRTVIELDSGTVAVHAKDLAGGELRVHSSRGDVVVHGTIFAVTDDENGLAVEVIVGKVSVTGGDREHSVTSGHRLLLSEVGAAEGPLTPERERAVRSLLGVPTVVGLEALPPTALPSTAAEAPATAGNGSIPRTAQTVARAEDSTRPSPSKPVPDVELDSEEAQPSQQAPADLLALAERERRAGDYARARDLYRRAAAGTGVTAEAAWVALARMELSLGHGAQALEATKRRQERFGRGTLSPEALWIDVRSYRQMGDLGKARELANQLVEKWPASPQARAAQQWLTGPAGP